MIYGKIHLLEFKKYLKDHESTAHIDLFQGYREIVNDFQFLAQMMEKRCVLLAETSVIPRTNDDIDCWNYIRTQQDADNFMKMFAGFHDATLDRLAYEEERNRRQLKVIFCNVGWYGVVECCFEGLIALNLRPYCENYSREIYSATLLVEDECIFWADDDLKCEGLSYEGSYIKAYRIHNSIRLFYFILLYGGKRKKT